MFIADFTRLERGGRVELNRHPQLPHALFELRFLLPIKPAMQVLCQFRLRQLVLVLLAFRHISTGGTAKVRHLVGEFLIAALTDALCWVARTTTLSRPVVSAAITWIKHRSPRPPDPTSGGGEIVKQAATAQRKTICPDDARKAAAAAWRRFVACVEALPADLAAPFWRDVQAHAAAVRRLIDWVHPDYSSMETPPQTKTTI